jgi:hypothetical protein
MNKGKEIFKIVALALPVLAMALLIGMHIQNRGNGTLWEVPVTGYDPRDLLRGHYLTFRYDWDWEMSTSCKRGEACILCLRENAPGSRYNPKVQIVNAEDAPKQCAAFIQGHGNGSVNQFEIGPKKGNGLRRYYIPEAEARRLDGLLRGWNREENGEHKFAMGLRVSQDGRAFVERMYIDGTALEEWLKDNPAPNHERP